MHGSANAGTCSALSFPVGIADREHILNAYLFYFKGFIV